MEDGIITKGELMGKIERMRGKMGRFVFISSANRHFQDRMVGDEYS